MKLSLRQRALLLIVALQVVVVGAEFALLAGQIRGSSRQVAAELAGELVSTVRGQIQPHGEINAARILAWPKWGQPLQDALLLDRNLTRALDGTVTPQGLALNPFGSFHREVDFDYSGVYAAIQFAVERGVPVDDVAGGRVVPIDTQSGVWGACWYRIQPGLGETKRLLWLFFCVLVASTLILSSSLFFALRREVLDPVGALTSAARRVAGGDLSAQVEVPDQKDELSELARTFNGMVAEVRGFSARLESEVKRATEQAERAQAAAMTQRRLAATGELAAGIAHEINNPLGGLLNAVERLKHDQLPPPKRAEYFELLTNGLERIRHTVGRLLRLTPRQARRAPVAIAQPVLDAVALVRHRAARQGVAIAISDGVRASEADPLPAELALSLAALPSIEGESHELGQALLNLLVNALDALEARAPGQGRIDVVVQADRTSPSGPRLSIEVRDNGPGVTREELGRVSDLFYTTKAPGKGTGLGLAIVHNVVASHGGTLELDSAPGQGFRVTIHLPLDGGERR